MISNVLHIDLSNKRFWIEERSDLFKEWLGGIGAGIRLLHEDCPKNIDPLSPENPIIFCIGPFNGIYPLASKTVAVFKSPLTKNLGESHAGGRCGVAMRMAGYGGIVIKGASEKPIYLVINEDGVKFRDASALWGMNSSSTVGRIIREREAGAGVRAIMRIGRAGEKLIPYACVITETFRHFGRLGLGAVFGSKKLKAILIHGRSSIRLSDPRLYRNTYDEIFNAVIKSGAMKKYHDIGTSLNVLPLNISSSLPSRNLQAAKFEGAELLSGENLAEKFLGRRAACAHCPVSCIHIAALRIPYENEPYFYKTKMIAYDYEPIYSLGCMLGIRNPEGFLKLVDIVDELGLDAISTGVILAWATECMERGIIETKDADNLVLKWGDYETYIKAIKKIVNLENEFYEALANGVEHASSLYGGREFALAYGGNEMPGYHCGLATHIGFAVGMRHSHLDNAGYDLDQKINAEKKFISIEEIAKALFEEESWRQILSSLVVCFFSRKVYTPEMISRCFSAMGIKVEPSELKIKGMKILKEKYKFKIREGFSFDNVRIPKRVLEIPTPQGLLREEDIRRGISEYKKLIEAEL
ncbi:MAG: aldehyde ferredoxin oxidoreductase family protein [Candidatus Methanomethyliaceae archaeon]|nr:aldehyde ferredoxin oxidoreductase family protein [Candidatus Methanomethyliaceae archaeon]MDW7970629.1 aldehyde ferredoxin oxidoreductase family protein [Nitrososphaerota archaeon]